MMSKIPADVERLMWLVSESNDPHAIRDFEARFPQFGPELARRRRMVADLKGAKGHPTPPDNRIPAFTPRPAPTATSARSLWVVGSLAAVALAFGSYSIGVWMTKEPPKLPPVQPVETRPPVVPDTNIYTPPAQTKPNPPEPTATVPAGTTPPPVANHEPLRTLTLANTSLTAALKMIGQVAGYNVEIAPGFKDQQVSIDYTDVTTSEMIRDLGTRYGFTAFDQGEGTLIIVPAVDDAGSTGDPKEPERKLG